MNSVDTRETELSVGVYKSRGVSLVRGEGALLWDDQGKQYIDCTAGIGVANIGHANPVLVNAIAEQAKRLITCAGIFPNDVRAECMEKLVEISPAGLERVFLCNSGAESIEGALKFVRQTTGRNKVVSANRGFHGRTMGALSATPSKKYQDPFSPLVPGFSYVPYNQVEALKKAVDENTAAVLLELVQGEGGVYAAEQSYIDAAVEICKANGAMLIIDEIQTGFCRTGKMFACEHYGVEPDVLCLAKGIAGGVPMGAILVNGKIESSVGAHGSTFGGNPLACAAFLATIGVMEREQLAERAAELGDRFVRKLLKDKPPQVRAVRHVGLMIGIELKVRSTPYLQKLQDQGVLALPAGTTVLRLLPPLVISEAQMDEVLDRLLTILESETESAPA